MYIKEIKINGFKSFADKTVIELNKSFTGIVGPNGSGKSNVVDAIKWVLGEQSVKNLRGESTMSDVIFCGSASRSALSSAYVSILFDNSDRTLNTDYDEVQIKRVVYRTGENEYYINNDKVRLKDITNLLIDSMSSKESLNIVPQKKVDQILSEKSEDRRSIFEDAAGVLKYKTRKIECMRKLEKTHENTSKIDLIIDEIKNTINPLEKESIKAREYKEAINKLKNTEIALIVKDINRFNELLINNNTKKDELTDKLSQLESSSSIDNTSLEQIKSQILKIDEQIKDYSTELISINNTLVSLSNKKTLLSERNKYDKESSDIINRTLVLKDTLLKTQSDYNKINILINNLDIELNTLNDKINNINNSINKLTKDKESLSNEYTINTRKNLEITNKIELINSNINNMSKVPFGVKSILNNISLKGICGMIGDIIETKDEYKTVIDTSLGFSSYNIITEDENSAKEAIEYLKRNNKGRATFFPLNIIKSKNIDYKVLESIKNINGFIDVASNLVTCDTKYNNIIANQLGNIIVCKDIDSALKISKTINHSYRVVSLDGEMIHVGGSLTGGSANKNNTYIIDKYELEKLTIEQTYIKDKITNILSELDNINKDIELNKNNLFDLSIKSNSLKETIDNRKEERELINNNINSINEELNTLTDKTSESEEESILKEYYEKENYKNDLSIKLEFVNKQKSDLNNDLNILENIIKVSNNNINELNNNINKLDVDIAKINAVLDNLLNRLNDDYSMTYERAKSEYILEIEESEAREIVSSLRHKVKSLGDVNLGSIEEYERLSTRLNFLSKQKEDLIKSENDLLNIINDMDNIMKDKFIDTFNKVNIEFNNVFRSLFKGGEAHLKLTNPDNILETGVDIIAVPSGKSLKPLSLLSGGERTLTAISLLFATMNLKNVPFVVLDEVESDLDDNNVSVFCNYLKRYKEKTQLLIITHKKKTMEYLDVLYGVTMQESGVSKLVSVRLEE